jgi:hypothetical protein
MKVLVLAEWNWFYWRPNEAIKLVIVKDKGKKKIKYQEVQ